VRRWCENVSSVLVLCLCWKEPIRTVATAAAACVPKSGRDSVGVTIAPTPSPSTSAARSISSRRRSFSYPRKSGRVSPICWPVSRPPRNLEEEEAAEAAVGYSDISVSSGKNQHVRVRS